MLVVNVCASSSTSCQLSVLKGTMGLLLRAGGGEIVRTVMHWVLPPPPVVSNSTGASLRSTLESVEKTLTMIEKASICETKGCEGRERFRRRVMRSSCRTQPLARGSLYISRCRLANHTEKATSK